MWCINSGGSILVMDYLNLKSAGYSFTSILPGQSLALALVVANRKCPLEESTGEISFTVGSTSSMTLPEHRHEYDYDEKLTCKV